MLISQPSPLQGFLHILHCCCVCLVSAAFVCPSSLPPVCVHMCIYPDMAIDDWHWNSFCILIQLHVHNFSLLFLPQARSRLQYIHNVKPSAIQLQPGANFSRNKEDVIFTVKARYGISPLFQTADIQYKSVKNKFPLF